MREIFIEEIFSDEVIVRRIKELALFEGAQIPEKQILVSIKDEVEDGADDMIVVFNPAKDIGSLLKKISAQPITKCEKLTSRTLELRDRNIRFTLTFYDDDECVLTYTLIKNKTMGQQLKLINSVLVAQAKDEGRKVK